MINNRHIFCLLPFCLCIPYFTVNKFFEHIKPDILRKQRQVLCVEGLPHKIEGLLLEETKEFGPVFVETESFTFAVGIL